MGTKLKAAIIGPGNIGTDLMIKILRNAKHVDMSVLVGIDPASDGLARASRLGVKSISGGVQELVTLPEWNDIKIVFDATSAKAHHANWKIISQYPDKKMIDLTPAAVGPFTVPPVNLDINANLKNYNMVTCGGQATIPIVAAINRVSPVIYGEIVASIASKSAGPGTRANIDEFTKTTAQAIESVGGAKKGKAIIILNPAEPPLVMRDTVFTLSKTENKNEIINSIHDMVEQVQQYVPAYSLHQDIQFDYIPESSPIRIDGVGACHGLKTSVFLKVQGAGHYLPEYAGNLDIMTSAALATAEKLALHDIKTVSL